LPIKNSRRPRRPPGSPDPQLPACCSSCEFKYKLFAVSSIWPAGLEHQHRHLQRTKGKANCGVLHLNCTLNFDIPIALRQQRKSSDAAAEDRIRQLQLLPAILSSSLPVYKGAAQFIGQICKRIELQLNASKMSAIQGLRMPETHTSTPTQLQKNSGASRNH